MAGKSLFTEQEWDSWEGGDWGGAARLGERPRLLRLVQGGVVAGEAPRQRSEGREPARTRVRRGRPTGFGLPASPDEVENESYSAFVLELAESAGKAAGGDDQAEAAALEKFKAALA
jgi:hypothetical protein